MNEDVEDARLAMSEWGTGGMFYEWFDGAHTRSILFEILWFEAMAKVFTCMAVAKSAGHLAFTEQSIMAHVMHISEILEEGK